VSYFVPIMVTYRTVVDFDIKIHTTYNAAGCGTAFATGVKSDATGGVAVARTVTTPPFNISGRTERRRLPGSAGLTLASLPRWRAAATALAGGIIDSLLLPEGVSGQSARPAGVSAGMPAVRARCIRAPLLQPSTYAHRLCCGLRRSVAPLTRCKMLMAGVAGWGDHLRDVFTAWYTAISLGATAYSGLCATAWYSATRAVGRATPPPPCLPVFSLTLGTLFAAYGGGRRMTYSPHSGKRSLDIMLPGRHLSTST